MDILFTTRVRKKIDTFISRQSRSQIAYPQQEQQK